MQRQLCIKTKEKERIKAELMQNIIEKVIKIAKEDIVISSGIDKIEKELTPILGKIRKEVTKKLIEEQDVKKAMCACGKAMINKQKVPIKIVGLVTYEIKRRSFYCQSCKIYKQPLDKVVKLKGRFSQEVKEAMILLGQRIPFEEASVFLKTLLKVNASHKSIQILVENVGKQIAEAEKKSVRKIVNVEGRIRNWEEKSKQLKIGIAYMQMDGCMVQTREDSWKEVRNGVLFRERDCIQIDKNHKSIFKKQYFSVFNSRKDSLQAFKDRATKEAYAFKFHRYEDSVIIGDGAKWIWEYANKEHPYATQILDYYHACEYLGEACQSLSFIEVKEKNIIKTQLFKWLSDGKIMLIIRSLNKQHSTEKIETCIRYFKNNISRMDYGTYKKKGFDIGSGAIESAHRIIVQSRMKQAGMHWGKKNVQSILSLRAKYLSGAWDDIVDSYLKVA